MAMDPDIFDKIRLPPEMDRYLRDANPWWEGKPGPVLPKYQRWLFATLLRKLKGGPAPVVVLRGARQVGKTTLQEQVIRHLLEEERVSPQRILRVQFDELPGLRALREPVLGLVKWFEGRILRSTLNEAAHAGKPAILFIDEVQNLADWAPQIKSLVDHHTVRAAITGSSALRIAAGRDSLAGRITTLELGPLLLREIAGLRFRREIPALLPENGLGPLLDPDFWRELSAHGRRYRRLRDRAFGDFSRLGGYPRLHVQADRSWEEVADQLNEDVIERVLRHDLRPVRSGRDRQLLDEVFRLACRYTGQTPSQALWTLEIRAALGEPVSWRRILTCLRVLEGSLLVRLIRPIELRLKRTPAPPKVCVADHALRASWLGEVIPLDPEGLAEAPELADLSGHVAEGVVGAYLGAFPHLDLAHFPERGAEGEVDFVLTVGDRRIPLEVKYRRRIDPFRDTLALRSFVEKAHYRAPFGVLVTMLDDVVVPDPRIIPVSLRSLLLMR